MNKKIIALAVSATLLSATSYAANIYDDGKSTFNLGGEIDTYLATAEKNGVKASADISTWVKLQANASHAVTDTVTVFGSFEIENGNWFGFDGDDLYPNSNGFNSDDYYFGASFGENYSFAMGEIGDFGHSLRYVVIDNSNEGFEYVDDVAWLFESKGHAAAFKAEFDSLTIVADAYTSNNEDFDTAFGITASYDIADFNVALAYQDQGNRYAYDSAEEGTTNNFFAVKAGYSNAGFDIAANYVLEEKRSEEITAYGLAASYSIEALRFYGVYSAAENAEQDFDFTTYTFGADYAVLNNLSVFLEYAQYENFGFESNDYNHSVLGAYYTF